MAKKGYFDVSSRDSMGFKTMIVDPGRPGDEPPQDPIKDDDRGQPINGEKPPGMGAKYPHDMFDCSTGKKYVANDESDHKRYAALGYVHSLSECKTNGSSSEPSILDNYSFLGFVALAAIGITLIG